MKRLMVCLAGIRFRFNILFLILIVNVVSLSASPLGAVRNFVKDGKSVTVFTDRGLLVITPFTENIIKVTTSTSVSNNVQNQSPIVVLNPEVNYSVRDLGETILVSTGKTDVIIDKSNALLKFRMKDKIVLEEYEGIVNGGKEKKATFKSRGNESFYATGERGYSYDLKGDTLIMFNKQNYGYGKSNARQMNITVPFYISSLGYGVFFDDYTASQLILKNPVEYITNSSNPISYYFIGGDSTIASVVENYTLLTGRQELAPFWSLGYITSKYGYKTEEEARNVIKTLRDNGYPVDGIVLDLYWYGEETDMGRFDWNTEQWPNHKKMLADFKADGVKTIIISQPYLNKIGAIDNYNMAKKAGMLTVDSLGNVHDVNTWVGEAGMLDVSNPVTREWMWSRYEDLTDEGVSGWWGDLGEPEVHPLTIRHFNGETAAEYHNLYGNDWSKIIYDGFKKKYPDTRLMTLMRGGTAGLQRFSVFPWSTDVGRSWDGLQAQIPIMVNSALSGMGYMSHDVGGFAVDKADPTDDELYARWLELGLFTPVLRTHSTVDAEPYHYTKPGYQNLFRNIIKSRYQWLPYNYTLAYENALTGAPFVRPLNYYDASDKRLANIQDQFLWGRNVMVAPVVEEGAISREIIFPEGEWIDMHMPQMTYLGPSKVTYAAPLPVLPVFVKAGAFIPMAMYDMRHTGDYDPARYTIKYFPKGTKSSYTLFDDDKVSTTSIRDKAYQLIKFEGDDNIRNTTITLTADGKGYKGMPAQRMMIFEIPAWFVAPQSVKINGKNIKRGSSVESIGDMGYYYDAETDKLWIKMDWNYRPVTITINK